MKDACPICRKNDKKYLTETKGLFHIYRCLRCGIHYNVEKEAK